MNGCRTQFVISLMLAWLFLSACAPAPTLTYGGDSWKLTGVGTVDEVKGDGSSAPLFADEGQVFLQLTFESVTEKCLVDLDRYLSDVYVTDNQNTRYWVVNTSVALAVVEGRIELHRCGTHTVTFSDMPKDRQGLQLHFFDMPPVELGR